MTGRGIVSNHEDVDFSRVPSEELVQFDQQQGKAARVILFKCGFWQEAKVIKSES